jgi:hypothetical protein
MGLSNAERQAAWRARHKDEPRPLPVAAKTKLSEAQAEVKALRAQLEDTEDELKQAQEGQEWLLEQLEEAKAIRAQLGEVPVMPGRRALRIEPEMLPGGQELTTSELRLDTLCSGLYRQYNDGYLGILIALIDAEGAEAVIGAMRRYIAFRLAKEQQRDDAKRAKDERRDAREAAKLRRGAVTA